MTKRKQSRREERKEMEGKARKGKRRKDGEKKRTGFEYKTKLGKTWYADLLTRNWKI